MFYSQIILAKKGPLGKIWLAAHWSEKLTKSQIFSTSIKTSVGSIVRPVVPLALRVSGHLLLGVVRIYNRKVKYLFTDCNDALSKMKLAFRVEELDMPARTFEISAAAVNISNFGSFDPAENFEDEMVDEWALLALRRGDRNTVEDEQDMSMTMHDDIDLEDGDDMMDGRKRSLTGAGGINRSFRSKTGESTWLAFDEGDNDLPEVLRNEERSRVELERDSIVADDPELLRRKSNATIGVGRDSLMSLEGQNSQRMSMEPLDMGDAGDLNVSATPGRISGASAFAMTPGDDSFSVDSSVVARPVARRKKRRKLCQVDAVTKISASERRKRSALALTRSNLPAARRRRVEPMTSDTLPSFMSTGAAPALRRFVAIMCSEGPLMSRFGPHAGRLPSDLPSFRDSFAEVEDDAGHEDSHFDDFPNDGGVDDSTSMLLAPSEMNESVLSYRDDPADNVEKDAEETSWSGIALHESTKRVLTNIQPALKKSGAVRDFQATLKGATRKEAASGFFELLVLATKHDLVSLDQAKPYGAIRVGATSRFTRAVSVSS